MGNPQAEVPDRANLRIAHARRGILRSGIPAIIRIRNHIPAHRGRKRVLQRRGLPIRRGRKGRPHPMPRKTRVMLLTMKEKQPVLPLTRRAPVLPLMQTARAIRLKRRKRRKRSSASGRISANGCSSWKKNRWTSWHFRRIHVSHLRQNHSQRKQKRRWSRCCVRLREPSIYSSATSTNI